MKIGKDVQRAIEQVYADIDMALGVPGVTHYLPYFTKDGPKGTQEAACTEFVSPALHANEPTCHGCKAWLDNDAEALKKLRDVEKGAY